MTLSEYINTLRGKTVDAKLIVLSKKIGSTTSEIKNWLYKKSEPKGALIKRFFYKKGVSVWWGENLQDAEQVTPASVQTEQVSNKSSLDDIMKN